MESPSNLLAACFLDSLTSCGLPPLSRPLPRSHSPSLLPFLTVVSSFPHIPISYHPYLPSLAFLTPTNLGPLRAPSPVTVLSFPTAHLLHVLHLHHCYSSPDFTVHSYTLSTPSTFSLSSFILLNFALFNSSLPPLPSQLLNSQRWLVKSFQPLLTGLTWKYTTADLKWGFSTARPSYLVSPNQFVLFFPYDDYFILFICPQSPRNSSLVPSRD